MTKRYLVFFGLPTSFFPQEKKGEQIIKIRRGYALLCIGAIVRVATYIAKPQKNTGFLSSKRSGVLIVKKGKLKPTNVSQGFGAGDVSIIC